MENDFDEECWDFWESVGITCGGYDSQQDLDVINVFKETSKSPHWHINIAKNLNLDTRYVTLIMEILCSAGFCEYGTSPRGSWAIHDKYQENLNKLEDWYNRRWL